MDMYFFLASFIPDISHVWAICIDPSMRYMHYILYIYYIISLYIIPSTVEIH